MGPDWSLLPPDLLQVTTEKFTSLADYIRFRAVCHPWRLTASPTPRHLPVQLPWVMLPYHLPNCDSTRLFYDLSSSKIHRLDFPKIPMVDICGSSHGWLFLLHEGSVASLLNPLTHATIHLPPFTAPHARFMPDDDDDQVKGMNGLHHISISGVRKAMLTSSPLDSSCLVFVTTYWAAAFCKIGDKCWTVIEYKTNRCFGIDFCDLSYSNGFFYMVDRYANVTVYNMTSPSKMLLPGSHGENFVDDVHLVEGMSGDILLIEYSKRSAEFTVYKLNNDVPDMIKLTDIGDNVILLVDHLQALSFSSANLQLPGWGRNCICHVSRSCLDWNDSHYNYNIKLTNIGNETVTDMIGNLGTFQMCSYWQDCLWLTPSLL